MQVALLGDNQRVDLDQREILVDEQLGQAHEDFDELLDLVTLEAELEREFAALVWLGTHQRVNGGPQDFLRRLVGDFFNLDTTFRGRHENDTTRGAIDHRAEIEFIGDIGTGFNQYLAHRLAVGIRLVSHQVLAQPFTGEFPDLVLALDQLYTPRLAATASVHLGFYHPHGAAYQARCIHRFLGSFYRIAPGNRQPVFGKQLLALILMKIHLLSCLRRLLWL